MATKDQVLIFLQQSKESLSGEEISKRLGITRTAVWKSIRTLREEGYKIDSATNRGYKLLSEPDTLCPERIRTKEDQTIFFQNIQCFDCVDSTNEEAKRQALQGAPIGSLFLSEEQTHGKGRLGRVWSSQPGTGLWFSVLLGGAYLPEPPACLTLLAGLAVCRAIRNQTALKAEIKWPNDLVIGTRKICGILTETISEEDRILTVILGIGINVNQRFFPEELSKKATSLCLEKGTPVPRIPLLRKILMELEHLLSQKAELPQHLEEYKSVCCSLHRKVGFLHDSQERTGTAFDITKNGELLVQSEDNQIYSVHSGEVTVQGIYE